jgi:hypothetical protein
MNFKKNIKTYCFDIDGVICFTKGNDYVNSRPNIKGIKKINELHSKGNIIIVFTARFMGRSAEDANLAKKKAYNLTRNQLKKWGVNYAKLIFGKPSFDYIIDDKSIFFKKDWHKFI